MDIPVSRDCAVVPYFRIGASRSFESSILSSFVRLPPRLVRIVISLPGFHFNGSGAIEVVASLTLLIKLASDSGSDLMSISESSSLVTFDCAFMSRYECLASSSPLSASVNGEVFLVKFAPGGTKSRRSDLAFRFCAADQRFLRGVEF